MTNRNRTLRILLAALALLAVLALPEKLVNVIRCKNPRCITTVEQELPQIFKLTDPEKRVYRCVYCETKESR